MNVSNVPPQDLPLNYGDNKEVHIIVEWIVLLVSLFQSRFVISNNAISWLLKFLYAVFRLLGRFSNKISAIAEAIPHSVYQHKRSQHCTFKKYNVCKKCNSLYSHEECIQLGQCPYKPLPRSRRCGELLLKQIVSSSGQKRLYPHKIFCVSPLLSSLQKLVLQNGFIEHCESTRNLFSVSGLSDVYDGNIWQSFQEIDSKAFLSGPNNYGLLLNIDWYQPFEHLTYSVGVIYLVVLNLPRSIRFKRENVLLYGLIPGPSEPSLTVNSYLSPMISDLLDLWEGKELIIPGSATKVKFRCALLGVSCDLPAARKTCGFLSHSATLGCSKCYHRFFDGSGSADYGGNFDRESWTLRTNIKHRADVAKIRKCSTKTAMSAAELKHGCRYSVLLDLPYFDPVKMLLVDPMHNLFLGTAKHFMFDVLIGQNAFSKEKLDKIKLRLSRAVVPGGLGRLPTSINVSTFLTAEQWKNWTVYFSIYCLHDLLPKEQLECWRHFVLACCRLCQFSVSESDLTIADALLIRFCKRFKQIFGVNSLTPNIHMHCHIVSCIRDFGPFHSFWLFPFERYNGILGNLPNNNRSIEVQLMHRFHMDNSNEKLATDAKKYEFFEYFQELIELNSVNKSNEVTLGGRYILAALSQDHVPIVRRLYAKLYPDFSDDIASELICVPTTFRKYSYLTKNGKRINSMLKPSAKNTYALAVPVFAFSSSPPDFRVEDLRPVRIHYFMEHSLLFPGMEEPKTHLLANVSWPMVHPKRSALGKPVEVWCNELYEPNNKNTFIPVSTISKRVIYSIDQVCDENVLIIIPLIE